MSELVGESRAASMLRLFGRTVPIDDLIYPPPVSFRSLCTTFFFPVQFFLNHYYKKLYYIVL